jgi:hypothetical protein
MNLNDAQKQTVAGWIAEGLKLSDIQKRLMTDYGQNLTYMEVRLLVDDLKLMPKDPPPKVEKTISTTPVSPAGDLAPQPGLGQPAPTPSLPLPGESLAGNGKVSVVVDVVAKPGSLVSGSATFSDGQSATWYLDQMGRLGIAAKQPGYKPSPADLQTFQQVLEAELSKIGF